MNATECPSGYSNFDELALRQSDDCHISDANVQAVQWFNIASLSALAVMSIVKAFPLVRQGKFQWDYIPHAVVLCWGTFGVLTSSLYIYKAATGAKVSEVHTTELIFHSLAPIPFFPAVWLFVFSLMAAACSSEIGARASLLRRRFWQVARFFMVTEMILYPLPFWLTIAFPSWVNATSVCMVLNLVSIALPIGVSTGVFVRMIDGVLAGVVDQEKAKLAANEKRAGQKSALPTPRPDTTSSKGSTVFASFSNALRGGFTAGSVGRFGVAVNLKSSRYNAPTKSSALVRQLEANRRRMRIAAYVVCFGTTLPGAIMLSLSLAVDYMGRNSFVTYSACYGLGAIIGMGAVFVVKASPPNKHTNPSMFLGGAGSLGDGLRARVDKVFEVIHHYSTEGALRFSLPVSGSRKTAVEGEVRPRRPLSFPLQSGSRNLASGHPGDEKSRVEILTIPPPLPLPLPLPLGRGKGRTQHQQQQQENDGASSPAVSVVAASSAGDAAGTASPAPPASSSSGGVQLPEFHVRPYHSRSAPEASSCRGTVIHVASSSRRGSPATMEDLELGTAGGGGGLRFCRRRNK